MRNGPIVVILLVLAAAFGAWLGPAGEKVDPELGPMEAYFRSVLKQRTHRGTERFPTRVYLSVRGQDPPPALLLRFAGEIHPLSKRPQSEATWAAIDLQELKWTEDRIRVACTGSWTDAWGKTPEREVLELSLSPQGKWQPVKP